MLKKRGVIFLLTPFLLIGCGKEREHKPISKIEVMEKALVDTQAEYLYVPSTGQVSRTTSISRPYFQGQERIVKLEFTEHHLAAYAIDKETQFEDNDTNKKLVFRIPIEHVDYRERTDAFGEGTNVEEVNEFISWKDRKYFKARPEAFEFTSVEWLPTAFSEVFGGQSCVTSQGQSDLEFSVTKSGIDVVIKRDFVSKFNCEGLVEDILDLTWSEETHYSLVPLKSLASENYQATAYDRQWERTFGYFDHLDRHLDSSNSDTQAQERHLIHRWNPNREKIIYHLDPRFNKAENRVLKQATLKGVERINAALKEAGAKVRVEAQDGGEGFRPGNMRYSSIVLVEDPVRSGLLGYGPSVAHPRTGEILQARTVMYPGIMKKLIQRAYDELIEIHNKGVQPGPSETESAQNNLQERFLKGLAQGQAAFKNKRPWSKFKGDLHHLKSTPVDPNTEVQPEVAAQKSEAFQAKAFFKTTLQSFKSLFYEFLNSEKKGSHNLHHMDLVEVYSHHNMMPARVEVFSDITDGVLKDKILALGEGQAWELLPESKRKNIVDLVMPYVWIPTLIHEIGHNLGLRHNFQGSEDKDNFYTLEELAQKGVKSEYGSPYSSMMEYSKSEITGLRVPGKYDVAALRYGYANKVELPDGRIVEADQVVPAMIKPYGYCSDEGVSLNPNCNRFDEGSDLVEIVDSIIDSHEQFYKRAHFRKGRSHFSLFDDFIIASRTNANYRSLRLAYERLVDIMLDFGLDMDQVKTIEWLNTYNEAAVKAARFLIKEVAQPDYSCVLFRNGQFDTIMSFVELQNLTFSLEANTCFEISGLNAEFQIVGDLGKSFLSRKYSSNPNIYLDQIDVRGVWFQKLLAMHYLTARSLNSYSFDDHTVSYLDHPEIGSEVSSFIKDLIYGDVTANVKINFIDGSELETPYEHSFSKGYEIPRSLYGIMNHIFDLPQTKLDLVEALVMRAKGNMLKGNITPASTNFYEALRVRQTVPQGTAHQDKYMAYNLAGEDFVVGPYNEVGRRILERLKLVHEVYAQFERDKLIDLYLKMVGPDPFEPQTEAEIKVVQGGEDTLFKHLTGALPSDDHYFRVLSRM